MIKNTSVRSFIKIINTKTINPQIKILVTGGTGLVGSYLLRLLIEQGYQNIHATKREQSSFSLLQGKEQQVNWHDTTLNDVLGLEDAIKDSEVIIHCAAVVSFDPRDKRELIKTNVEGTANIVNLAVEQGVRKLIHVSSIAALGRNKTTGLTSETDKFDADAPHSLYSLTKYLAEMEVWRGKEEGLKITIVNPAIILGSGFWKVGSNGFFNHVWRQSPFYPPGATSFVDVRDVARFINMHIESDFSVEQYLLISENRSYQWFLETIAKYLHKKAPTTKTTKLILGLAWRVDKVRSILTGSKPLLTRETAQTSLHKYQFDHARSLLSGAFTYRSLEQTIADIAAQYRIAAENGFQPATLSFQSKESEYAG
ncbi:MAG TPA: NAD-dependent epimerase/dehydratase family protein [Saprospiraceae bacterium]|nr:NAD-dependent epimerase/dehydratase family protein [Saprospiraceae bacterium]